VRRSLDRLAELGLIEIIGSGKNLAVRLRERHPLARSLRSLFRDELQVLELITSATREIFLRRHLPLQAVWIENPSMRSPGTIDIGVLGTPGEIEHIARSIELDLREIEPALAAHFVVHAYTDADLHLLTREQIQRLERVTLLHGWIPHLWREYGGGPIRTHHDLNVRARQIASALAKRLTSDPSILEGAREWIEEQLKKPHLHEHRDLQEWKSILTELSVRQIQSFLTEDSERAERLRQSMPFVEILTEAERTAIIMGEPT
jgi:hypothetical protein